ncbi:MAG: hypothetical protein DRP74_08290 [Candidatus Omnitrophota bacterium]|nr:MAG: hypothetical protein DRP74_08290 [Candidatus Omnitrophota bacterium]
MQLTILKAGNLRKRVFLLLVFIFVFLCLIAFSVFWLIKKYSVEKPVVPTEEPIKQTEYAPETKYVLDELLVKFKSGTSAETKSAIHNQLGGVVKETIPQLGIDIVKVSERELWKKLYAYQNNPFVEYAEFNSIIGFPPPSETDETDKGKSSFLNKDLIENEIVVIFKKGTPDSVIEQLHQQLGCSVKMEITPNFQIIEVPPDMLMETLKSYRESPYVENAELQYIW